MTQEHIYCSKEYFEGEWIDFMIHFTDIIAVYKSNIKETVVIETDIYANQSYFIVLGDFDKMIGLLLNIHSPLLWPNYEVRCN
jgi:signal transduction histidine kinase